MILQKSNNLQGFNIIWNSVTITGDSQNLKKIIKGIINSNNFFSSVKPIYIFYNSDTPVSDLFLMSWGSKSEAHIYNIEDLQKYLDIDKELMKESICIDFSCYGYPPIFVYDELLKKGFQVDASYYSPDTHIVGIYKESKHHDYTYNQEVANDVIDFFQTTFNYVYIDV